MGVPGFFLWLWKNYKKSNFVFTKSKMLDEHILSELSNIDYLLIDANCLIHPVCFKVLADNKDLKNINKLELKMMNAVLEYIDKLIKYVKPKEVYIAIDGVAPIAKIKQQRSRRFKSVHDRVLFDNIKKKHGKEIPFFWSNSAITPGTDFMVKLHNKLYNWCQSQDYPIYYSSCNTPSEGEHKLLQFIRNDVKNKENKYVIYGLDADLIFLALSTGLDSIYLLREASEMDRTKSGDELNLVSIKIMRELLCDTIKNDIKNEIDIDIKLDDGRLIADFIFLCYLMGNDFLPHLPSLDIYNNATGYLIKKYANILVQNNFEYLLDFKKINKKFFSEILEDVGEEEDDLLIKNFTNKKFKKCHSSDHYEREMFRIENMQFKFDDPIKLGSDNSIDWKERYYKHYFGEYNDGIVEDVVKEYLIGLQWITNYYFDKCSSWNWYYKYNHPPFLSDISNHIDKFDFNKIKFKMGQPLKPYMQLLSVLPPQSAYLLPYNVKKCMLDHQSELHHLYPTKITYDYISKKKYWMVMPNLPNLEIDLIKSNFDKIKDKFDKNDNLKNRIAKIYYFSK
jgi:5'-3' exonuclease